MAWSHKNPGFFHFQKGRWLPAPDSQPISCNKESGFFVFRVNYQRLKKGAGEYGGIKWRIKWVPNLWELFRNTVLILALPVSQKSLYARRLLCVRGVHSPAMLFCVRAGTGSVCAPDWWNYLRRLSVRTVIPAKPPSGWGCAERVCISAFRDSICSFILAISAGKERIRLSSNRNCLVL